MRVVNNLKEIDKCPNCGNADLCFVKDIVSGIDYKHCLKCSERIYEGKEAPDVVITSTEFMTPGEEAAEDIREEIANLKWFAHTVEDAQMLEHLSLILNKIADYIEEH